MEKFDYDDLLHFQIKLNFYRFCKENDYKCPYSISDNEIKLRLSGLSNDERKKLFNKAHSVTQRKYNLRLRINYLLKNVNCMFVTFTLDNEHVNNSLPTIRKYITRLLKSMNCYYVGNVDYGHTTERLHFHFVVGSDDKEFIKSHYKIGFCDIKMINNKNSYKLANYIDKIVNHGLKDSTKRRASIITSRGDYSFTFVLEALKYSNHDDDTYKNIYDSLESCRNTIIENDFDIW